MNVLIVLTTNDELGTSGRKTGFWLEELAAPYYAFKDAGADVTLASPLGGRPPLDPRSDTADFQTDDTRRFRADPEAEASLANTVKLSGTRLRIMTRCSVAAATAPCGTWPKMRRPSP
jgi:putative intracellular protease/amidase